MTVTTTIPFANRAELAERVARGERIAVLNGPQFTSKTQLGEPSNGTCAVTGTDGKPVSVWIKSGAIVRVESAR